MKRRGPAAPVCALILLAMLSCARPLPIVVVSLENELVTLPPGAPLSPYAGEKTAFRVTVQNAGRTGIPADSAAAFFPALGLQDFSAEKGPVYLAGEGLWDPSLGEPLGPGQKARIWIWGAFRSPGEKAVTAKTPYSGIESRLIVLADPGCLDSDLGDDSDERGWVIGSRFPGESPERFVDRCSGGYAGKALIEFSCGNGNVEENEIPCPGGCRAGICLAPRTLGPGEPYAKLAALFAANGEPGKARSEWLKCLKADAAHPACLKALGHPAKPAKAAGPAVPVPAPVRDAHEDRRSAIRHWHRGIIFFQKGDMPKARDEWLLCKGFDPDNLDCATGLQRIDAAAPGGL